MAVLPEAYDASKIRFYIEQYDKTYPTGPDSIYEAIQAEKQEQIELMLRGNVNQRTGVINHDEAGNRMAFTMPSLLYRALRKQFPTVFKADLKKFRKDFPVFFEAWKP